MKFLYALSVVFLLSLTGCSFLRALPLEKVVAVVQDATLILDQVESFVGTYFKAHPAPDKERQAIDAIQRARAALVATQRAADGFGAVVEGAYLASLADFREAYEAMLKALEGVPGFAVGEGLRSGPDGLVVPPPRALSVE